MKTITCVPLWQRHSLRRDRPVDVRRYRTVGPVVDHDGARDDHDGARDDNDRRPAAVPVLAANNAAAVDRHPAELIVTARRL